MMISSILDLTLVAPINDCQLLKYSLQSCSPATTAHLQRKFTLHKPGRGFVVSSGGVSVIYRYVWM